MASSLNPFYLNVRSAAHWLDQPHVIGTLEKVSKRFGLPAFVLGKAAYDMYTAPPGKRKEQAARSGLVLVPTFFATKWGLERLERLETDGEKEILDAALSKKYPRLKSQLGRFEKGFPFQDIKTILKEILGNKTGLAKKVASADLEKIFPHSLEDSHVGEMLINLVKRNLPKAKAHMKLWRTDKMVNFFGVGGIIVLAGLAGGLIGDALFGFKDKLASVNKIKEAIFQFVANIAMCAIGATLGMLTVKLLSGIKSISKIVTSRIVKFPIILAGLSLGIVFGGNIANMVGRRLVNPFFEWVDNRHRGLTFKQALAKGKFNENDRKVEFLDAILHLDDLPTALALAGMQVFVPFIPLFFAMSAMRAGDGYRNKDNAPSKVQSLKSRFSLTDARPLAKRSIDIDMANAVKNPFVSAGYPYSTHVYHSYKSASATRKAV